MLGMVRAGEIGGGLSKGLDSAAQLYEASASARRNLVTALAYPTFLLIACVGSLVLLIKVVLPKFGGMLAELGQPLPSSTAALMDAARVLGRVGPGTTLFLAVAAVGIWQTTRAERGRAKCHGILLKVPLIGAARQAWASASVCSTMASLLHAGVPFAASLKHAIQACGDSAIAARIAAARTDVLSGARPSETLERHEALTSTCIRLCRAGEESGNVAGMLDRAAQLERARSLRMIQDAIRLLEPCMILVFGGIVAFVAAALLQAMYAIRPAS
jgi:general secretion pathway protein F